MNVLTPVMSPFLPLLVSSEDARRERLCPNSARCCSRNFLVFYRCSYNGRGAGAHGPPPPVPPPVALAQAWPTGGSSTTNTRSIAGSANSSSASTTRQASPRSSGGSTRSAFRPRRTCGRSATKSSAGHRPRDAGDVCLEVVAGVPGANLPGRSRRGAFFCRGHSF